MTLEWSGDALAHPALASVAAYASRLRARDGWPSVAELDAILRDGLADVSLEPQRKKKSRRRGRPVDPASLYVVRIADAKRIPTRERSWHDALNALVWAAFPRSKRALTARQRAIVDRVLPPGVTALPSARTREEDALAMIDEGGIVVLAHDPSALERAHRDGDVAEIAAAITAGRARAHVFGHALMEHAIAGDASVRGYAIVLAVDGALDVPAADRALARWIDAREELAPAPWRGLPLSAIA